MQDMRWEQRFDSFSDALAALNDAILLAHERKLTILERSGLIQHFEFAYELAWKTLQDLLHFKGYTMSGPNPIIKQAFKDGYITDAEGWAGMKRSRDLTVHTYQRNLAEKIEQDILTGYLTLFVDLKNRLKQEII